MPGPCPGSGLAPCPTTPTVTQPRRYPMLYRASTSVTATRSPRTRSPGAGSPGAAGSAAPGPGGGSCRSRVPADGRPADAVAGQPARHDHAHTDGHRRAVSGLGQADRQPVQHRGIEIHDRNVRRKARRAESLAAGEHGHLVGRPHAGQVRLPEADDDPALLPALAEDDAVRARRPAGPDPYPVADAGVAGQRETGLRVRVHEAGPRRGVVGGQPENRVSELQAQHDPAVPDRNVRAAVKIDPVRAV